MHSSRNGTIPDAAVFNSCRSTDGSSAATDTIRSACRDDNVPARIAASVAGNDSSFPATSIARFASPVETPVNRWQSSAALRSFL